jgi:hypothetical protein
MISRRGLLAGILSSGIAPGIIYHPMKLWVPKTVIPVERILYEFLNRHIDIRQVIIPTDSPIEEFIANHRSDMEQAALWEPEWMHVPLNGNIVKFPVW